MKKLSLKILFEDEQKTSAGIKMPKKKKNARPQLPGGKFVSKPITTSDQQQNSIDIKDKMYPSPHRFENARKNLEQYKTANNQYTVPDSVANELIKQFGSLEDAQMELFGDKQVGIEIDRDVSAKGQIDRVKSSMPKLNAQAQAVKLKPMPAVNPEFEPTPEEEEELKSFGTGRGLPQTFAQMQAKAQAYKASGQQPEVWDPNSQTYIHINTGGETTQKQVMPPMPSQTNPSVQKQQRKTFPV